ncbi:MAG: hypothetical protein CVU43_07125 [Chloroflexi bacterium HGW-Chloroflexi-5]|jgi:glycosyltransferase involved in cell wall biosynthesis|nr:MAG: hypothetical protein CVU43_07125 [Chloroflexi bacterium HGW-Chloroflexi-5]
MSTVALFSSEPFYEIEGVRYFTRSKWETISLQSKPFEKVILALPRSFSKPLTTELVTVPENYHWLPLYNYVERSTLLIRIQNLFRTIHQYLTHYREWDVTYIRLFFWDSFVIGLLCILFQREMFVSLHGDIEETILINWQVKKYPKLFNQIMAKLIGAFTRSICNKASLLFVSGPVLAEKYAPKRKDAISFLDSSYSESEIFVREDCCNGSEIQVLYVGELVQRKGVDYLLDAFSILHNQSLFNLRLKLIGTGNINFYQERVNKLQLRDVVDFEGYVPYGPLLFKYFQTSDIFVLPSIGTEGWSRVLIEAAANSLPVVTTDVGSLGRSTREFNCGIVVNPKSAEEIADAIKKIITNSELRKKLITGAVNRAKFHTRSQEENRVWSALTAEYTQSKVSNVKNEK